MLAPNPHCPSCHGQGVITITVQERRERMLMTLDCRCIGGVAWQAPPRGR